MAKRFTDSEKWKRPWFRGLPVLAKLAWFYVLDNCDNCGVWPADFELMSFQLREIVAPQDFATWFTDKAVPLSPDKYFIPSFIEFQYGKLNPDNKAHKPVLSFLEKEVRGKVLPRGFQGAQEKKKEKEQEKSQEKEGESEGKQQSASGIPPEIKSEWEATLKHYRRDPNWTRDEATLFRVYQRARDWTRVRYALAGYRFETKKPDYDPAQNTSLTRLTKPGSFDHLEALGEQGINPRNTHKPVYDPDEVAS